MRYDIADTERIMRTLEDKVVRDDPRVQKAFREAAARVIENGNKRIRAEQERRGQIMAEEAVRQWRFQQNLQKRMSR